MAIADTEDEELKAESLYKVGICYYNLNKFDRAFESYFKGIEALDDLFKELIPEDWLKSELEKFLTEEEMEKIESMGGFDELMDALRDRLENQEKYDRPREKGFPLAIPHGSQAHLCG